MFASTPTEGLREFGHSRTVEDYKISEHHKRAKDPVNVFSWEAGLRYGHAEDLSRQKLHHYTFSLIYRSNIKYSHTKAGTNIQYK